MNTQLLIGAKETPARGGKTFDRLNPITGECVTRAAAASVEDANLAASAAAIAFPAGGNGTQRSPRSFEQSCRCAGGKLRSSPPP